MKCLRHTKILTFSWLKSFLKIQITKKTLVVLLTLCHYILFTHSCSSKKRTYLRLICKTMCFVTSILILKFPTLLHPSSTKCTWTELTLFVILAVDFLAERSIFEYFSTFNLLICFYWMFCGELVKTTRPRRNYIQ